MVAAWRLEAAERAKEFGRKTLAFRLDQFDDSPNFENSSRGKESTKAAGVAPSDAGIGAFRTQRKRRDVFKRLRRLLGSGQAMSEEQVSRLSVAGLNVLQQNERQAFYRCVRDVCSYSKNSSR